MTFLPLSNNRLHSRIHYVDSLRVLLMFLGIPFHAAFVYSGLPWYTGENGNPVISSVAAFIHTFRMPAFFLVAGIFAARAITETTLGTWMRFRLRRLAVPLIAGTAILGPIQLFIIAKTQTGPPDLVGRWTAMLAFPSLWVFQLWFLLNLLIYSAILAACVLVFGRDRISTCVDRFVEVCTPGRTRIFLALAACGTAVTVLWAATVFIGIDSVALGFVSTRLLVLDAPTFALGVAIGYRDDLLVRFSSCSAATAAMTVVSAMLLAWVAGVDSLVAELGEHFMIPVVGIAMASVLMTAARKFLDTRTRITSYLADAAMTVYVFHNVLILDLALILLNYTLPGPVEYVVIIVITTAASLLIHAVISRVGILSMLFNGRRGRRGSAVPQPGRAITT
ncbi:acyltransferase family protein [Rhodococcus erythropolis]|uniref:acyltransferase family protein n=1 Tax=Rhodococcus erythropolis TaxID=1833 RepID=UPI0008789A6E|nr:acyltransferase family protein [Rhodococcus erythropolis]